MEVLTKVVLVVFLVVATGMILDVSTARVAKSSGNSCATRVRR